MSAVGPQSSYDPLALSLNDALRLAAADERFAKTLLASPEDFQQPFNLNDAELKALSQAARIEPIEDALNSVPKLVSDSAENKPSPENPELDFNDLLRLATLDEELAVALMSSPEDFKEPFNLNDAQMDAIIEVTQIEPITDALETLKRKISGSRESSPSRLNLDDALRLSKVDQRFAGALTVSTDDFASAFNLEPADLETLKQELGKAAK